MPKRHLPAVGERVRAVIEGDGETHRHAGEVRVRVPYRAVIVGEVTGWELDPAHPGDVLVTLAGWGRVPAGSIRRRRWWRR